MNFISPLFVILPRKTMKDKKYILNLNNYPHWHYIVYNNLKKKYSEEMTEQMKGVKLETPITINFILYKNSNRSSDRSNTLCVIEKFFCDALVNHGVIPDDSDEYISDTHYFDNGVDKNNGRVEIEVV